ncbi:MAG: sensor histidine kinase [Bacteroidia bacterium]
MHTRIQHLDSAAFYFKLVNKNIKRAHSSKLLNDYYEYYSNYLKARGNLELSYTYLDSAHKNSRTNSQGLFTEQIANYQILFDAQKDEFEKQQLKISLLQEQKTLAKTYSKLAFQKKIIYLSLIILLLALIIISFYYFAKRRIDIVNSKLKSVNNQLTDSLSENKALVGIIAHDLKSPFGQIKGLIDILEDEQELNHTYLAMIKRSCANGNDLVNDLITAHKVETIETTLSKFDLSSFIGELKTNYSVLAAQKGITLNIDIKHSFEVLSDRRLLYRVFDNLITNAIKFSQKNETISITAEQKNQEIKLCVIDNGPGIDSNEQKIIFEKFKRGKSKPTAGESSSGLGLYITKLICQKLNHQLLLTSKIGKGSNFCIIINNEQA